MTDLLEFVLDLFLSGLAPSSERWLVGIFAAGALIAGCAVATLPPQSEWDVPLLIAAMASGSIGAGLSLLHLHRNPYDLTFSMVTLVASVAGAAIALLA